MQDHERNDMVLTETSLEALRDKSLSSGGQEQCGWTTEKTLQQLFPGTVNDVADLIAHFEMEEWGSAALDDVWDERGLDLANHRRHKLVLEETPSSLGVLSSTNQKLAAKSPQ